MRECPACRKPFIMGGVVGWKRDPNSGRTAILGQVDYNPAAPVEIYRAWGTVLDRVLRLFRKPPASHFPIAGCPHCKTLLTSDAFPVAGELISYNAPMLESDAQFVDEDAPLELPRTIATKSSQNDVEGWMRDA